MTYQKLVWLVFNNPDSNPVTGSILFTDSDERQMIIFPDTGENPIVGPNGLVLKITGRLDTVIIYKVNCSESGYVSDYAILVSELLLYYRLCVAGTGERRFHYYQIKHYLTF